LRKRLITAILSAGLLLGTATPGSAIVRRHHYYHHRTYYRYNGARARAIRHRRHMRTLKRVGIGAAGGAVIGAIAGGGKGAAIGGAAGAGAGALYDRYKRHHRRR
jgi:outer membrane lipoprotein SlyB